MLMKPFSKKQTERPMKISPYSRRKGWATLLASVGTDMVKVRVLLRHSIGNLRHYVRLEPNSLVQTQEAVLAKWDQNSLNVSDFTLPVLMELTNIAVDDDGVRSRHCIATFCLESPASASPNFATLPPSTHPQFEGQKDPASDEEASQRRGQGPGAEAAEEGACRTVQCGVSKAFRVRPRTPNCKYPHRKPQLVGGDATASLDADEDPYNQEQLWMFLPQPRWSICSLGLHRRSFRYPGVLFGTSFPKA